MLLDAEGHLPYLDEHMDRMAGSAAALEFPFDEEKIRTALLSWLGEDVSGPMVVRMRLDKRGATWFELHPVPTVDINHTLKVLLSDSSMDSSNPLLKHKTTDRTVYDTELATARGRGFDEVLYTNATGELTEGAITSLFIRTDDGWITPAVECGLLPGTWRARYLDETGARETRITKEILPKALEVVMGNAVRGTMSVSEIIDSAGEILFKMPR
jgi:para-aminobenzoate synthetase/4-amino-4-deoxychorismate lyase